MAPSGYFQDILPPEDSEDDEDLEEDEVEYVTSAVNIRLPGIGSLPVSRNQIITKQVKHV